MGAQREFTHNRAALQHSVVKLAVLFGIAHIDARPEYADRSAIHRQSALMTDRINASRSPVENDKPPPRQSAPKPLGHLCPVERRSSRAHHSNTRLSQHLRIAAHI